MSLKKVGRGSINCLTEIFGCHQKVVIGVVHCPAFPGTPHYAGADSEQLFSNALKDAMAYAKGGVHGLIVENHGDVPFSKPEDIGYETAAFMAVATDRIRRETGLPVGVNVLPPVVPNSFGSINGPTPMLPMRGSSKGLRPLLCVIVHSYVPGKFVYLPMSTSNTEPMPLLRIAPWQS